MRIGSSVAVSADNSGPATRCTRLKCRKTTKIRYINTYTKRERQEERATGKFIKEKHVVQSQTEYPHKKGENSKYRRKPPHRNSEYVPAKPMRIVHFVICGNDNGPHCQSTHITAPAMQYFVKRRNYIQSSHRKIFEDSKHGQ